LAIVFRMNKALFILAANISLFPPVIWFASLAMGRWLDGNPVWTWPAGGFHWSDAMKAGKEFIWGGVVLALLAGGLTFLISYVWLSRIRRRKNKSVS